MQRYTTIGAVYDHLIRHYAQTGKTQDFHTAVQQLDASYFSNERPSPVCDRIASLLPDEEFFSFVRELPVEAEQLISENNPKIKTEELILPLDRNIIGFCTLPHVNDGMHIHDHFEVNYVYAGHAEFFTDSGSRTLQAGDCFFISPGMPHNVLIHTEDSFALSFMIRRAAFEDVLRISLPYDNLIALFFGNNSFVQNNGSYLYFHSDPEDLPLRKLVQDIMLASNSSSMYGDVFSTLLLFQFFCSLLRDYSDSAIHFGLGKDIGDTRAFLRILLKVQSEFRTITLEKLSQETNYSPSYLSRLFQKKLGRSFSNVVQSLKIREVSRLLLNTDFSIARITEEVGYDSPNYLSRIFKSYYQCTPSEYRRMHRR